MAHYETMLIDGEVLTSFVASTAKTSKIFRVQNFLDKTALIKPTAAGAMDDCTIDILVAMHDTHGATGDYFPLKTALGGTIAKDVIFPFSVTDIFHFFKVRVTPGTNVPSSVQILVFGGRPPL